MPSTRRTQGTVTSACPRGGVGDAGLPCGVAPPARRRRRRRRTPARHSARQGVGPGDCRGAGLLLGQGVSPRHTPWDAYACRGAEHRSHRTPLGWAPRCAASPSPFSGWPWWPAAPRRNTHRKRPRPRPSRRRAPRSRRRRRSTSCGLHPQVPAGQNGVTAGDGDGEFSATEASSRASSPARSTVSTRKYRHHLCR